jgi:thiamine biosynthesis lipoprotein
VTARHVDHVMGMPISLALRGRHAHDAAGSAAWGQVMEDLRCADRTFSTWREDSWISRLARGDVRLDDCPPEVSEVLEIGNRAAAESAGAFAISRPGPDGAVVFDPSGVVKGWAAARAARHLTALDETDFCLSAGGDLVARTCDPAGPGWSIGIEDPYDAGRIIARVLVHTGAVATSGSAHRGDHVVDARTGVAPTGVAQVTVIGDDLTWVDIEATAAYAQGLTAASWLRTRTGRTGVVVWADGRAEVVG